MTEHKPDSIKQLISASVQSLRAGHHEKVQELTDAILEQQADHAGAHAIQFSSFFKSKQFERARRMGGRAAELNPRSVFILNNQACLQLEAKQPAAAAGLLKSLIDEFGEQAQWLYNLALAQRMVGNFEKAITLFQRTLDLKTDHDKAAFQLAECLSLTAQQDKTVQAFDYVRLLRNKHAPSHSHFINAAVLADAVTPIALEQEMALWGERFIPAEKRYQIETVSDSKSLRIGFITSEMPASWFNASVRPVINQMAAGPDQVTVYAHHSMPTEINESVTIVDCTALSDADFARKVRGDQIEVLIDVCGLRPGHRQRALGLQVAGRQFSWLAHEGCFTSNLIRSLDDELGNKRYCFSMQPQAPTIQIGIPPAERNRQQEPAQLGQRCFAAISVEHGLSHQVLKTWATILQQVPDWSLNFDVASDAVETSLRSRCEELSMEPSRLSFHADPAYAGDSIVLDNFVYNNPLQSYVALQNGRPLLTLNGTLFPAQHSAALLKQLGLANEICLTPFDYQQKAVALALGKDTYPMVDAKTLRRAGIEDVEDICARIRKVLLA